MRCFLALELSEAARRHLGRVQDALRKQLPRATYPRADKLHITLKFLGEVAEKDIAPLCESMQHVKLSAPLTLAAVSADCFPPRGAPRIVVATMGGSEGSVAALHQAIEQRCVKLGFESDHRRFRPHVTLARLRSGVSESTTATMQQILHNCWPGPDFELASFVLFESELHPSGSRYVKLATFDFAG